jgi:hypothetical protein
MKMPSATMSWVAEAKPVIQKNSSESLKKPSNGSTSATAPSEPIIKSCIARIHQRWPRNGSSSGAHSGFSTQGR